MRRVSMLGWLTGKPVPFCGRVGGSVQAPVAGTQQTVVPPLRAALGGLALMGLLLSILVLPNLASAQVRDLGVRWFTLSVGRFDIHYHEPLESVARRVAAILATIDEPLSESLEHRFGGRLQVVLTDGTDSANGSATAIPYPIMRLFATAPDDLSALGDYDDWYATLVIHEHTHILHLDNIGGLPALLNAILGRTVTPNGAQPRWFIEGYATYMESAKTTGGRLRSSLFEMVMRMDVLEGDLLPLDKMTNGIDAWPGGQVPYLYGSRFVEFIAERYGDKALSAMAREYGRETLPYGINRVAKRVTGKSFVELYEQWRDAIAVEQRAVDERVRAAGLVEGERLTQHGQVARAPRYLDDNSLIYYVSDGRSDASLRLIDPRSGEPRADLFRVVGATYAAADPTGRYLYYEGIDAHRDIYFLQDLFRFDRRTGRSERLTNGLRARQPDISPDGREIVFAAGGAGSSELRIAKVTDIRATQRVIWRGAPYEQAYTPRFSPDGKAIAFSAWRTGGRRDILLLDRASGELEALTDDRSFDTGPAFSPDGSTLYFSSDRGGIPNLYAFDLESRALHQITNVVSGAMHPAPSPDGKTLVYLGYTSAGFDLFRLPIDRTAWRSPTAPTEREAPSPLADKGADRPRKPYDPLPSAWPRNYLVGVDQDAFGPRLTANIRSGDVVGFFDYDAAIAISLTRGYVNGSFSVQLNRSPLPLYASVSRRVSHGYGLRVADEDRRWVQDTIGGEIGISYPLPRAFDYEALSLSYSIADLRKAEPFGGVLDPNTSPPTIPSTGRVAALNAAWSYSSVRSHALDMTSSAGTAAALRFSLADPGLGSEYRALMLRYALAHYIENPFIDHHVLALRYSGGVSGGDLGRRGLFSIGGFPEGPVLDGLLTLQALGGVALRGYPPGDRWGTQYHLLQAEYRFPIVRVEHGFQTLPIFLQRLYAMAFADVGDAFFGPLDWRSFRVGSGMELLADISIGYFLPLSFRLGVAYGFHDNGGLHWYLNFGSPF